MIPHHVFQQFGLRSEDFKVEKIGSGHIHFTFKLIGSPTAYILQRINNFVFKNPEAIASNLRVASAYLKKHYPHFLFLTPIVSISGEPMVYDEQGFPWRLFPYYEDTFTVDKVEKPEDAFAAAAEFARLGKYLDGIDTSLFINTIDRFHDLQWRWHQFEDSLQIASSERLSTADDAIANAKRFQYLVAEYNRLIESGDLHTRITHNDTKINNVLFDAKTGKTLCAIDLDTLMPGYFIYDIGDMVRTFVSPVDEEEKDLSLISVRKNIYDAVVDGYLSEMNAVLTNREKQAIPFAGMMMTYIMALRMLTDYLNGDIYYQTHYAGQNLVRAANQFRLLSLLERTVEQ